MSSRGHSVAFALLSLVCGLGCGSVGQDAPQAAQQEKVEEQGQGLNLLCSSGTQCDDGHACTLDLCVAGACVHGPDLGCCEEASDCDQELACSVVSCVANSCVQTPIVGCGEDAQPDAGTKSSDDDAGGDDVLGVLCSSDEQCEDGDPCTDDVCLVAGGVCLFTSNPLCCERASDCEGIVACHAGECVDHRCSLNLVPQCVAEDAGADAAAEVTEPDESDDTDVVTADDTADDADVVTADDTVDDADVVTADDGVEQQGTNWDGGGTETSADDSAHDDAVTGSETTADEPADDSGDEATSDDATLDDSAGDDANDDAHDDATGHEPEEEGETTAGGKGDTSDTHIDDGAGADDADDDANKDDERGSDDRATTDDDSSGPLKPPAVHFADDSHDEANDDGTGSDAGVTEPGVSAEMTGGACSVVAQRTDATRGAWMLLVLAACAFGRRRK